MSGEIGWVEAHRGDMCCDPGVWLSSQIHDERPVVMQSTGVEVCGFQVCAVVPADEWDARNDLDAAVERAARQTRSHWPAWDDLSESGRDWHRNRVRPIVLAALGRES